MSLSFDRLWTWIAIALPAFVALLVPLPAVDLAYQVRAGNEILASGAVPHVDTWTFTVAGTAWVDQQWLAQVVLAGLHRLGGWELLAVARAALVAGSTGLLVGAARARGASARTAAILGLLAFALAAPALALRPQLLGFAIAAALLWLIAARQRRPGLYLVAPVLVAAWANVHGSFVLGPALLGYAWLADVAAGRPAGRSFAVLAAGTLATLVNPFFVGAWTYAVGIGVNPAIAGQVSEWQRTTPLAVPGLLFYPSVLITAGLGLRRRATMAWPDWVLLGAMAVIGAWAVRGVAWWAPVMTFLLAGILAGARGGSPEGAVAASVRPQRASALNGVTAALIGGLVLVAVPWWRPADPLTGRAGLLTYAPSALAARLGTLAGPGSRVVVPQTWGSWFEWAVPDATYLIDSRFELFPADAWSAYATIGRGGTDAGAVLDRYGVDVVVLQAGAAPPDGGWSVAYGDADGSILVRDRKGLPESSP